MKKASVTVFISWIMVCLLGLITAVSQVVKYQNMKVVARMRESNAIHSTFGEYSKNLYKYYGVFAIDGSYMGETYSEENILDRYGYYGGDKDKVKVESLQLITDNGSAPLLESILEYMESQSVVGVLEELLGQADTWDQIQLGEDKVDESVDELTGVKEKLETDSSDTGEEEGQKETNVLQDFEGFDFDIIYPIISKSVQVSDANIDVEVLPSRRELNSGYGTGYEKELNETTSKMLLAEYIYDIFPSQMKAEEEEQEGTASTDVLQYQMEYILEGKSSDEANLKGVIHKLLLLRTPINYACLLTDTIKQAEAHVLATSLSVASGAVVPEGVIYQALLWAWSYCESIVDVKSLVEGNKIEMVKTKDDWQFGLASIFTFTSNDIGGANQENGLNYQEYLKILLYLESRDGLIDRTADMIEHNIQKHYEEDTFYIDNCVTRIQLDVTTEIGGGYRYQFPIKYGYR